MNVQYSDLHATPVAGSNGDHDYVAVPHADQVVDRLPVSLLSVAHSSTWLPVTLDDINQPSADFPVKNIFLTDCVLKSHDPNVIFERVRQRLGQDQYFAFSIVTAENIKFSLRAISVPLVFTLYYPIHFLFRRVLPKLKGFRKLCRVLNVPNDVSKTEIIGRLFYKGFSLVDIQETDYKTVLIAKRNGANDPSLTKPVPSEGFLFRMQRMGQYANPIQVYKLRSMHPYAEYVQAYLHDTQGLDKGGKFRNDFRVSTGGRVIRKYWLDELPMLYNVLKGDIKLVGVRPISEHYFSLYPTRAQTIRIRHKPGLLPPYYADMPQSFEEIVQSELNYLSAYEKAPLQTDLRYLGRILTNIIIKKARST